MAEFRVFGDDFFLGCARPDTALQEQLSGFARNVVDGMERELLDAAFERFLCGEFEAEGFGTAGKREDCRPGCTRVQ